MTNTIDQETITAILEDGVDIANRRIYYGIMMHPQSGSGEDVCWHSIEKVIRAIHIMEGESSRKPIELHMSSPGGDPHELLRLYDTIQSSPCQIKFYGSGAIASAATWIMAGCDERYLTPNTRVLIHDSSGGGWSNLPSKLTDMYIHINEEKYIQDVLNRIYADNSRMPMEFWNEMVKRDLWLSAEETIALGLADKLIEPKKRGNLRKMRAALLSQQPNTKDTNRFVKMLKDRVFVDKLVKMEFKPRIDESDDEVDIDKY